MSFALVLIRHVYGIHVVCIERHKCAYTKEKEGVLLSAVGYIN